MRELRFFYSTFSYFMILFFIQLFIQSTNSYNHYGFGCNGNSQLQEQSPPLSSTCYEYNTILTPKILSPPYNTAIHQICTIFGKTIILTTDGSIYQYGDGDNNPIPTLVAGGVFNYAFGSEVDLYCGRNEAFYIVTKSTNEKELWGWGEGVNGILNQGNIAQQLIPVKVYDDFLFFQADSYVAHIVSPTEDIFSIGKNLNYHIGSITHGVNDDTSTFVPVDMNLLGLETSSIKFLVSFYDGVYVVFEDNTFYFWGNKELYLMKVPFADNVVVSPQKLDYDFSNFTVIKQIVCYYSCYAIIVVNGKNVVFSWGYYDANATPSTEYYFSHIENQLGRYYDVNESVSIPIYPQKIEDGDIHSWEQVVFIAVSLRTTFLITDANTVYGFGVNWGGLSTAIPYDATTISMKRILGNIATGSLKVNTQEKAHHHFVFNVETNWRVIIEIIIYCSISVVVVVSFICFLILFFSISTIVLLFVLKKNHSSVVKKSDEPEKELVEEEGIAFDDNESEINLAKSQMAKLSINEKLFSVKNEEVTLLSRLGSGKSNSEVLKAKWYEKIIAVKLFQTRVFGEQHDFDEFEKEIKVISNISHPNIIRFYGCCLSPPRVMILMEYCENGDLLTFVMRKKIDLEEMITLETKLSICEDVCSALSYLHSSSIIHRDLKPQNVLICKDYKAKLIDFGLSRIVKTQFSRKTKRVGTSFYMAPEVVLGNDYGYLADVFSFGIILYVILEENFQPYKNVNSNSIEIAVAQDPDLRPSFEDESKYHEDLVKICKDCWKHDAEKRISIKEILERIGIVKSELKKMEVDVYN